MTNGHVVLVGLMGTGKSTVGKKLATALAYDFFDTDAEIERRIGSTVAEIFEQHGEAFFRAAEEEVLAELLGRAAPMVMATGGGVVLSETNRSRLGPPHHVVWLRAEVRTLVSRMTPKGAAKRPLLAGDVGSRLAEMAEARSDLYRQVAMTIVDVDDLSSERVCEIIRSEVE
jgi:shikimate kinase